MRVLIVAVGSMGDVAPYTGLAARMRAAGHDVAIAAYARFEGMVRACGAEFREFPGDPTMIGEWTQAKNSSGALRGVAAKTVVFGESILEVAKQGRDDLILLSMAAMPGVHVAESLGIPSAGVFLEPLHPTAMHPPAFIGVGGSLGPWGNRAAGQLLLGVAGMLMHGALNELRSRLGLPTLSRRKLTEHMRTWPILHGYSPSVLPRPSDWVPAMEVTGYLWPAPAPDWHPPADIVNFLDAGPPPVFVGLGSRRMSEAEAATVGRIIDEALRRTGTRGVIQAGWSGLAARSQHTITIGETPYEWLFPRMAAVVHHAGAGTTAAGLRAGVPTVGIPILGSHPFWAGRVAALGAGPAPIPYKKLSVSRLTDAMSAALSQSAYRAAAEAVGRKIAAEDGAGNVLAALDRLADSASSIERS